MVDSALIGVTRGCTKPGMTIMQTWRESLLYVLVYNFSIKHVMLRSGNSVMYSVSVFYFTRARNATIKE